MGMVIDVAIGVWLLLALIWGIRHGLIRMVFGLGGIVLGIILAGQYSKELATKFPFDEKIAGIVAFIVIFLLVFIVAVVVGRILYRLFRWASLGWIDYLGGGLLGLLIGAMVAGGALTAVLRYMPEAASTIQSSRLGSFLVENFPLVLQLLPEEFRGLLFKGD